RNGLQERVQIRWADDVNATSERVRGERHGTQGRISTVASTHDAHFSRLGPARFHRPILAIEKISVHGASPLPVPRVDIFLSVARRPTEIDLQNGVPAVREPLRVTVQTPDVASPRPTVHE